MSVAFTPQTRALSPCQQVADALRQAGWPELMVPVMVAVARAESGCRREATARTSREYSVGPFQINLQAHPWVGEECARDYLCAARAALQIAQGGYDLTPWTAYRSGRYLQFLVGPEQTGAALADAARPILPQFRDLAPVSPALRWVVVAVALVLLAVAWSGIRRRR